jgi:hypothetical protein
MTSGQDAPDRSSGVVEGVDVDAVHDAVVACTGVAGLGTGLPGSSATYLPGRRVPGVRVSPNAVELEIRAAWDSSAPQIFAEIQQVLAIVAPGRRIDVTIADIDVPGAGTADPAEIERET